MDFRRLGMGALALLLAMSPPALAQVADPDGDADIPCIDITSLDVRGDTQWVVVELQTSMRPYPVRYAVKGVALDTLRLCPDSSYSFEIAVVRDGGRLSTIETLFDRDGIPTTLGPAGTSAAIDVAGGRIVWTVPVASLDAGPLPVAANVRVASTFHPRTARLLAPAVTSDLAPASPANFVLGTAAARLMDAAGGRLTVEGGPYSGAELVVPAGAVTVPTTFWSVIVPDPAPSSIEPPAEVVQFGPDDVRFATAVSVRLPRSGASYESLYRNDAGDSWWSMGRTECSTGMLCAETDRLSGATTLAGANAASWKTSKDKICHYDAQHSVVPVCYDIAVALPTTPSSSPYVPVLLVHGLQLRALGFLGCKRGNSDTFGEMPARLLGQRLDVWELNYDTSPHVRSLGDELQAAVDAVQLATGVASTTIVAHSLGGIVARDYIQYGTGAERLSRLITLGTPHLGTRSAAECDCDSCRDIGRPGYLPNRSPYVYSPLGDDTRDHYKALQGDTPNYVFIAGKGRAGSACAEDHGEFPYDADNNWLTDGIVAVNSALASDISPGLFIYPFTARRVTVDRYAHMALFARDDCSELAIAAPRHEDVTHLAYDEVLRDVKIVRSGQPDDLLSENFDSGAPPNWSPYCGSFSVANGVASLSYGALVLPGTFDRTQGLRIEADVNIQWGYAGDFNFFFFPSSSGPDASQCTVVKTGYNFGYYPAGSDNDFDLWIRSENFVNVKEQRSYVNRLTAGHWGHVVAELRPDGSVTSTIDGHVIITDNDRFWADGKIALRSWGTVYIDNVRISTLGSTSAQ